MSRSSGEIRKLRERRTIASTIGYCFVIVLIVLLVMSNMLTDTYTVVLESERAESMQAIAVASSTALGHTKINEGMTYPLEIYNYAPDKPYIVDIYTKAGNSFLRLYTSSDYNSTEQYYLSGVGDEYNTCFEEQTEAFTKRTDEDGVEYVCAIAPIISSENTVAGILEIRMPASDYRSTVNGMSLSWILTIFAIAVSMGIIIFELNLFVTTLSKGIAGNVPVLIMYGDGAIRFLSFFMALGAVMPPVIIANYLRIEFSEYKPFVIQILIALGLILYTAGFFGFSSIRKTLKFKLTGKIALLVSVALGYILSVAAGIADSAVVMLILLMPIAFCFGMPFDALRDYRINAGKLGYADFDDRTVHNIQSVGYFLGISVGTVIAGICFERFGMLVVYLIGGAALLLTSIGIIFFMKDNAPVRESYMPVNRWLELVSNKYTGRFLTSTFFVMGTVASFLLGFIPNYLETVGISLATSSFYFLVTTFSACVLGLIIKGRFAHVLTSKVRVMISSLCVCVGILLFALMPTAKILVVTVALLGISLGIHDYYYLYVLFLLANNRIKGNLRRAAELSFIAGIFAGLPVFALAFIFDMRIVLIIALIILFICSFLYPMSAFANDVDDKDPTLKKEKKGKKKKEKEVPAQQQDPAPSAAPQMPYDPASDPIAQAYAMEASADAYQAPAPYDPIAQAYAMEQGNTGYYENPDAYYQDPSQQSYDPNMYQDPNGGAYYQDPGQYPDPDGQGGYYDGPVE
ncbi:MAG: MFS transporter [Clostridiales bacterium]|nr:MFS transporter [Clostridiales bacterium]